MPGAGLEGVVRAIFLFAVGAVLAGLAALVAVRLTDPLIGAEPGKIALLLQIVLASGIGGLAYALYTKLMRIPELDQMISLVRSSLRRGGGGGSRGGPSDPEELSGGPPGMAE